MSDGLTVPPPPRYPKATVTGIFAATDFVEGDLIADRFRIVRLLGMGAMGMVYQAEDQQLNVPVALKLLKPELANKPEAFDRFRQELLLARQVSSPHVVRIHDLVQHQGVWLISMDYVAGESLEDLLSRESKLAPDRALQITRQLALGLAAAHQKGVVHRDLKPANVLLNEQGDALISDFGVARSIGETRLTQSGMVVGTPAYLSPEQAQAGKIDGRSDLYTLGLMLYEMLSGTLPFAHGTGSEMLVQRILRSPPSVQTTAPETPAWIAALLAALLTPKPEDRIASAEQLVAAIDRRMPPAQLQRRRNLRRIRSILPYAATGLLLCLAAFAIGMGWRTPSTVNNVAKLDDLTILPFGLEEPEAETRHRLQGAERILNASLSDQMVVADPEKARRAMAQLGLDTSTWSRNLPALFTLLPSKHWLEWFRDGDRGWQLRLWTRDKVSPETLLTLSAKESLDASALAKLQAAVQTRLGLKAPVAGLDLRQLPQDLIRAIGDPKSVQPSPENSPAPILAIWCSVRLSDLETAGERASAQVQARSCLDALSTSSGRIEKLARIHSALLLEQIEVASGLWTGLDDRDRLAAHLHARVLADSGDLEAAEHLMQTVGERDPSDGRAWFQAGKFAIMRGDARIAVDDYLVRAQVIANRQADAQLRADVANAFGVGFRRLGQLQAAADAYRQGAKLQEQAGNARGRATSMQNLSSVLSTLGRFDEAAEALTMAETLIRPLGDQRALADLRNDVGVLAEERGDFPAALAAYREALSMRLQRPDQRSVAESLLNVGFAYYQMGDFANAEVHWQQASERFGREQDLFGTVRAQQSLGLAYTARGDFARSRASFEQSLKVAEANQMGEERAVALAALAEQDRLEGKLDAARERANAALALFEARENPRGITEMKLLLASIAIHRRDVAGAASLLAELGADLGNLEQRAMWEVRQAQVLMLKGDRAAARNHANQAITLATQAHTAQVKVEAELELALASPRNEGSRLLTQAEADLAGFGSVPLQIRLYTVSQAINRDRCAEDHQLGLASLAKLPPFIGALAFHDAASLCRSLDAGQLERSRQQAATALELLIQGLAPPDRTFLLDEQSRRKASP